MTVARALLGVALVGASVVPVAAHTPVTVVVHPGKPRVGDMAWLHVRGSSPAATVDGSVGGRPLTFFPYAGGHAALVGLDIELKSGAHEWRVVVLEPQREPAPARGKLTVRPREFAVQRLTLPETMVTLDPETERRALGEIAELRTLYRTITPERLWRGRFTRPVGGTEPGVGFGARRIINDKPRAPHAGIDFGAAAGTPVVAANNGRVALVAEHFFPGRLVILDHGLGLYTLYFHLESFAVAQGDVVTRGQTIGTVGATGRATGPHLHFGAQLGESRIDPASLLELSILD